MENGAKVGSKEEHNEGLIKIKSLLEAVLPNGENFTLIHLRSHSQKCRKLIFTKSSDSRLDSVTTHYFLLIHEKIAVASLELFAYEAPDIFTIFISKADTTGHYYGTGRLNIMAVMQCWIRAVYRHYSPPNKTIRLALFAKAEGQYLFIGSIRNPRKHVLSDAELVKWWIRCLDGLSEDINTEVEMKSCLCIPGIDDPNGVAKYFPNYRKLSWSVGDIFGSLNISEDGRNPSDNLLAVKCIPRFPDDPKSRFLDSIVSEKRAKHVTKKQFFIELQSRQEFRLGKSVGIIGLEFKLRSELNEDLVKEPGAVTKRTCNRFKDLIISLNFESIESSTLATERILEGVSEDAKIRLTGRQKVTNRAEVTENPSNSSQNKREHHLSQPVNTLGASIVRKKRKADIPS